MIDQIIAFNKTFVEQKGYEGVGDCKSPPTVGPLSDGKQLK